MELPKVSHLQQIRQIGGSELKAIRMLMNDARHMNKLCHPLLANQDILLGDNMSTTTSGWSSNEQHIKSKHAWDF